MNVISPILGAILGHDQVMAGGDMRYPRDPNLPRHAVDPGNGDLLTAAFERRDDTSRRFVVFERPDGGLGEMWRVAWNQAAS